MPKRWIVWQNSLKQEGVVLDDAKEARLLSNRMWENGGSTLALDFLEMHEDSEGDFVLQEIEI